MELLAWLQAMRNSEQGSSTLRLKKRGHLAMAPAKAVAAGRVSIALTHILWQRLHR